MKKAKKPERTHAKARATGTKNHSSEKAVDILRLLSTLSRDIALTSEDLNPSLDKLLTRTAEKMHADALAVWTVDSNKDSMSISYAVGLKERFIRYFNHTDRVRIGKGIIGLSAKDSITHTLESTALSKEKDSWAALGPARWKTLFDEEQIKSLILTPMNIGDHSVGVLMAGHRKAHSYDANERFFFEALANQVAIALANYSNYVSMSENREQLKNQIGKLTHLQDSFQAINRYLHQSVEHALDFLAEYTEKTFRGKGVAIFEPDASGQKLILTGSSALPERFREAKRSEPLSLKMPLDSLAARAFVEKQPQFSERLFTDDRIGRKWIRLMSEDRITAEAVFPLSVEDRVFGVLAVYYDHLHPYTDEEKSVLGSFSQFFGILYENQKTFLSLAAEKQKTQAIVYSLRDGLLVYDLNDTIIDVNPRALEFLGATRDTLIGWNPLTEKKSGEGFDNITAVTQLTIPDFEIRPLTIITPEEREIEVMQVPLHEESYRKTGTLRILHDVTAERRSEFLKTNFVSTAAHQLRTPLTGIRWGISALNMEGERISDRQGKLLNQLQNTISYVISLVNDLLSVSELEQGRTQYDFQKQDVNLIIKRILDELAVEIRRKEIKMVFETLPDDSGIFATVDTTRMTLALQNIIDNAVRYTPVGGSVSIRTQKSTWSVMVSVSDSGIGISKEDQGLLFNKFFRASNAVRAVPDGSGLGLFLAKKIVEDHNGKIWVDSIVGKGTSFYIQLPTVEALTPKNNGAIKSVIKQEVGAGKSA